MSTSTEEAHKKSLNKAIDYINANLKNTIDLEALARVSHISKFHFHRIFRTHIGESVRSYVSRIRLEKAAQQLQTTSMSLARIAPKVGYGSQQSLSKAFKKHFGMAPSRFREMRIYFPTLHNLGQRNEHIMEPMIRFVGSSHLVYTRIIGKYGSSQEYDRAWHRLLEHGKAKEVLNDCTEYLGLSFDDPAITKDKQCRFYACITVEGPLKPEGEFGSLSLEGGKYAIFIHKGPYSGLNGLYRTIYLDWVPNNGVRLRKGIPFEKYLNSPDKVSQEDLITEVYIPIQ